MYTIQEELYILLYLVAFGIYLFSTLDIVTIICKKFKKKAIKIIIQVIFWLLQIYISFIFSYQLMSGYVPIYFIAFVYSGYFIYEKLLKKYFRKVINSIFLVLKRIIKLIIKLIKPLIYSKKLTTFLNKFLKREKRIIKKQLFTKPLNEENEEEQVALPRLNFAISTYYKGTGLEEILKKLEEYLDNADKAESDITNI